MLGGTSSSSISIIAGTSSGFVAMSLKKVYSCNNCQLVFDDLQTQRKHMREPWHVYNLKRRMADLPPITEDTYTQQVETDLISNRLETRHTKHPFKAPKATPTEHHNDSSEDQTDDEAQTDHCVFCTQISETLEKNLEHMSVEHGLYIPEIERISHLETMLHYLQKVITQYHECLYCGMTKHSADSIRRHMLDKGHCMINLEREPELLEFWELSDSDVEEEELSQQRSRSIETSITTNFAQGQHTLPSGKIIRSKKNAREAQLLARRLATATRQLPSATIAEGTADRTDMTGLKDLTATLMQIQAAGQEQSQDRTVSVRNAAGLIGVSDQQIRGLVTLERKMQRRQAVVHASMAWADELGGRNQKHYKQKMDLRSG